MNYIGFKKVMHPYPCFSTGEIANHYPSFDTRRLVEWQKKGYIHKLRNRFYCFTDTAITDDFLLYTANRLCRSSYVSLEWALLHYGIIPDLPPGPFPITSCTTSKTQTYDTPIGIFTYRHIKPDMFFGYRLYRWGGHSCVLAQPEKALLDFMYYHTEIKTLWDLRALEWDKQAIRDTASRSVLSYFTERCGSSATATRTFLIHQYLRYGGHYGSR